MPNKYLVVIPAYNEEDTIAQIVRLCRQYADVCVVDDGSSDQTPQLLSRFADIHVIRHDKNTHIPGAILDGMRFAFESDYDYCITMDAGMSHDPNAIPSFKEHIDVDLVLGYRQTKIDVPLYRKLLSKSGNLLINLILRRKNSKNGPTAFLDVTSGFRMYSKKAVQLLLRSQMKSRSFDFHLEALVYICRSGMSIKEIPIVYVQTNSSLKWKVVADALRTWARLAFSRPEDIIV